MDTIPVTDFLVVDHGSIWTFTPLTKPAEAHCAEHFPEDCQIFCKGYVVEPRYAYDIIDDIIGHGFWIRY